MSDKSRSGFLCPFNRISQRIPSSCADTVPDPHRHCTDAVLPVWSPVPSLPCRAYNSEKSYSDTHRCPFLHGKREPVLYFFHSFGSICIFHMKSCQKRTEPVQFHQKQWNMMQMEPVSCHITHLSFHRLKTTVRDQAFYLRRECMSCCHQYSSRPHGLSIQINWKLLFVSFRYIDCPLLHIPLFFCSKGNIFSSLSPQQRCSINRTSHWCSCRYFAMNDNVPKRLPRYPWLNMTIRFAYSVGRYNACSFNPSMLLI